MAEQIKTCRISQLIYLLGKLKEQVGDVKVFHQTDPEGNSFGTIDPTDVNNSFWYLTDTAQGKCITIHPHEENVAL